MSCTGRETHLQNCTLSQDASEDYHYEDASVRCFQPGECVTGELRLAGGNNASAGRVEVCVSGIWGTVSGDLWGVRDAGVVCGQLGFNRSCKYILIYVISMQSLQIQNTLCICYNYIFYTFAVLSLLTCCNVSLFLTVVSIAHSRAIFGQGTAPILMDNVQCVGNESKLVNCTFDPDASEDNHYKDAGVSCYNESG